MIPDFDKRFSASKSDSMMECDGAGAVGLEGRVIHPISIQIVNNTQKINIIANSAWISGRYPGIDLKLS